MIRVLAADDHPLALAGLRALLGSLEGIALVGAAASGDEAVRLAAEREPDVVLMDLEMPGTDGVQATRDVVRHNGSVVVLAVDDVTNPADPLVVIERQFRHAADQYLLELPAGRVEPGENVLAAAKRELMEETGYRAKKWTKLVRYYASPGFVGEWMEIYVATGIVAGTAEPEDDERIEVRLVPLSELVRMCTAGNIHDGKTLVGAMLYAERLRQR